MKFEERNFEKPLISVVIAASPTSGDALKMTLSSILSQDYENFELLAVTDGTDPPIEKDRRVKKVVAARKGKAQAFNEGLREAQGEFILFIEEGEELHSQFLSRGNEQLQLFDAGAMQCTTMVVRDNRLERLIPPVDTFLSYLRNLLVPQNVVIHSFLLRRDICKSFREDLPHLWARDFLLRSVVQGKVVTMNDYIGSFTTFKEGIPAEKRVQNELEEITLLSLHRNMARTPRMLFVYIVELSRRAALYSYAVRNSLVPVNDGYEQLLRKSWILPRFLFRRWVGKVLHPRQANIPSS